jgi:hypothetical protein
LSVDRMICRYAPLRVALLPRRGLSGRMSATPRRHRDTEGERGSVCVRTRNPSHEADKTLTPFTGGSRSSRSRPPAALLYRSYIRLVGQRLEIPREQRDRTAYLVADYSELYAAIGDRFGYGAQGTDFLVPDLRGQFLRGWDAGVGIDPEAAARSAASNGAAGDNIGSRQGHEIQEHDHAWTHRESDAGGGDQAQSWDTSTSDQGSRVYDTGLEGGVETRPINVAVSFIIKCGAADPC